MIKFVYFDVGGTVIKDFSGPNKVEHETEICCGKYPIESSLVLAIVSRFEKNEAIWPIIEKVKEHYRLGLLTNMYPGMFEAIMQKGLLPNIEWEIIIDSSRAGFCKPDKEIYTLAQEKLGVKPEEILFIDNTQENIDAAKNFGWQAVLYTTVPELETSLSQIGLW